MTNSHFVIALGLFLTGCGSNLSESTGGSPGLPASKVEFFYGDGTVKGPYGEDYGTTKTVAQRAIDPATSSASEDVVSVSSGQPAREFVVSYAINGSKFTMVEKNGAFTGTGELVGEAWRWNEWRSHAILAHDQGTVDSDDHENGTTLDATKTYYQADGSVGAVISEHLEAITYAEFETRRAELLKP